MTCADFARELQRAAEGEPLPAEARAHAAACPSCAFALRLESTLRDAPRWAERPRLSPELRAALLGRARTLSPAPSGSGAGTLLEQSAWNAAAALGLLALLYYGLPPVLQGTLPEGIYDALAHTVQGPLGLLREFLSPLLTQPWGLFALSAAGFTLCFSAALTAHLHGRTAEA